MIDKFIAIHEVPPEGKPVKITITDVKELKSIANILEISKLFTAELSALVTPFKDGLRIKGHVKATIEQECVVTLEPLQNSVDEKFDLTFLPDAIPPEFSDKDLEGEALVALLSEEDPPEPLINGRINLSDLLIEFIALGIDPYPRKPGVEFKDPNEGAVISPFEALKKLSPL